uniref:Uncharacterized protein n=1 Tax=Erwinia amylovora ATCC BAA-2158 TaxID=889211 RepID=E5B932_ERWAM|nr:hypothetical protein predicted by Glimmer/Critica [Erwinia amylovora ATCC BAA-2158]
MLRQMPGANGRRGSDNRRAKCRSEQTIAAVPPVAICKYV